MKIRSMALVSTMLACSATSGALAAERAKSSDAASAQQDIVVTAPRAQDKAREKQQSAPNMALLQKS